LIQITIALVDGATMEAMSYIRASMHELSLAGLAKLLGVRPSALHRLEGAGLLVPVGVDAEGEPRYSDGAYARLRLYLDLMEAGATTGELRVAASVDDGQTTAARVAGALIGVLDPILQRLQGKIDRLRALRADLIAARESLLRCHSCHRTVAELSCRDCRAMPQPLPRVVDKLFCPTDGPPRANGAAPEMDGEVRADGEE
jgi:DNA-binding transcriptional MerR regulator